jgi:hypothetical protein
MAAEVDQELFNVEGLGDFRNRLPDSLDRHRLFIIQD